MSHSFNLSVSRPFSQLSVFIVFLLAINRLNKADSWSSGRLLFTECIFQGFTYAKFHICECLRWGNRGLFVTRMLLYAIVLRNRCGCLWRKYGMVQWWVSRLSRPYKLTQDQKRERRECRGFELSECRVFYYNSKKFEKVNYKKKRKKKHLSYGRGDKIVSWSALLPPWQTSRLVSIYILIARNTESFRF